MTTDGCRVEALRLDGAGLRSGGLVIRYKARCRVNKKRFHGAIVVTYLTHKSVPEFDSLARAVKQMTRSAPTTLEEIALAVHDALLRALDHADVRVDAYVTSRGHVPAIATAGPPGIRGIWAPPGFQART